MDPNDTPSWQALLEQGQVAAALAAYPQEARDPEVLAALETLNELQAHLRERNYDRAIELLERLEPPPGLLDWPELQRQLAALKAAAQALSPHEPEGALTRLAPLDHPVLRAEVETLRGAGHIFLNETEAARQAFERATQHDPKHHRAITNLGNLALEAGRVDEAIVFYQRALALSPDFANAHHNLGVAYRRKGQIGKSVRSLRKAQGADQRKLREEARQSLKETMGGPTVRKYGKWLLYAALAVVIYFILRSRGFL